MVWAWYPYIVGVVSGLVLAGVGGIVYLQFIFKDDKGPEL